jgi:hypothetical protein
VAASLVVLLRDGGWRLSERVGSKRKKLRVWSDEEYPYKIMKTCLSLHEVHFSTPPDAPGTPCLSDAEEEAAQRPDPILEFLEDKDLWELVKGKRGAQGIKHRLARGVSPAEPWLKRISGEAREARRCGLQKMCVAAFSAVEARGRRRRGPAAPPLRPIEGAVPEVPPEIVYLADAPSAIAPCPLSRSALALPLSLPSDKAVEKIVLPSPEGEVLQDPLPMDIDEDFAVAQRLQTEAMREKGIRDERAAWSATKRSFAPPKGPPSMIYTHVRAVPLPDRAAKKRADLAALAARPSSAWNAATRSGDERPRSSWPSGSMKRPMKKSAKEAKRDKNRRYQVNLAKRRHKRG